jgi:hypothetical protein
MVTFCIDGVRTVHTVHKLVLEAFRGKAPLGKECAHNNGVRHDNRLTNLRWATRVENFADKRKHGTRLWGETGPSAKLTAAQVQHIRTLARTHSQCAIGRMYGVGGWTIGRILHGETWRG